MSNDSPVMRREAGPAVPGGAPAAGRGRFLLNVALDDTKHVASEEGAKTDPVVSL